MPPRPPPPPQPPKPGPPPKPPPPPPWPRWPCGPLAADSTLGPTPHERLTRKLKVIPEGLLPRFGASSVSPDCGMVSRQPNEVCAYCALPVHEDELAAIEGRSLKKSSPVR